MAYTLAIYTHKSTGKDRGAAETVAGVLLGAGWSCLNCKAAFIGTPPRKMGCARRAARPEVEAVWPPPHSVSAADAQAA